jgi:hypothetical protein
VAAAGRHAWWVELDEGGRPVVRAERGAVLADWRARPGGALALGRALERKRCVEHRADPSSALHREAARGLVLPLLDARGAELLGVLVLESEREHDLGERERAAAQAALDAHERPWWAAAFRAWHRARFGADLAWLLEGRFLGALGPALWAAGETRAPQLLVGPGGAGRRTLARWLHFRGPARASAVAEGAGPDPVGAGGTRVVELESLGLAEQRALARELEAGARARLFLVAEAPAPALRARGLLDRELERALEPLPLVVPRLADRRDEIPALVVALAADVARREGLPPPRFGDRALGDLWRQDWRGNVAELAALVAQLARSHPGREIDGAAVSAAFRSRRLHFRERLPSLRPRTVDLELALLATRHASGSWNRARAARYLGWDPDTLAARLRERRIEEAGGGSRREE